MLKEKEKYIFDPSGLISDREHPDIAELEFWGTDSGVFTLIKDHSEDLEDAISVAKSDEVD